MAVFVIVSDVTLCNLDMSTFSKSLLPFICMVVRLGKYSNPLRLSIVFVQVNSVAFIPSSVMMYSLPANLTSHPFVSAYSAITQFEIDATGVFGSAWMILISAFFKLFSTRTEPTLAFEAAKSL